jgi:hypothetical protein
MVNPKDTIVRKKSIFHESGGSKEKSLFHSIS